MYLEYASLYPNRSGGQVAYLEQAYPRPAFLFPTTYAFFAIALSSSSSNAVILARYIFRAAGHEATEWENKGVAMGFYTLLAAICIISNRWSIRAANLIAVVKVVILLFIVITGFVVLGGGTRVKDPHANFRGSFTDIHPTGNGIVNALVSVNFAYQGYNNAFNLVAEVRVCIRMTEITATKSNHQAETNANAQARSSYITIGRSHSLRFNQCSLFRRDPKGRDRQVEPAHCSAFLRGSVWSWCQRPSCLDSCLSSWKYPSHHHRFKPPDSRMRPPRRCSLVTHLGFNPAFWNANWPHIPKMGCDYDCDSGTSIRRRIQFCR